MIGRRFGSSVLTLGVLALAGCGGDPCNSLGSPRGALDPDWALQGRAPVGAVDCQGEDCCSVPRVAVLRTHQELQALMTSGELAGTDESVWRSQAWSPDNGYALALWHPQCPSLGFDVEVRWVRETDGQVEVGVCTPAQANAGQALSRPWTLVGLPGLKPDAVTLDAVPPEL